MVKWISQLTSDQSFWVRVLVGAQKTKIRWFISEKKKPEANHASGEELTIHSKQTTSCQEKDHLDNRNG